TQLDQDNYLAPNVQTFQARPEDIHIATYHKFYCSLVILLGTTWVSYILDLLHFGQTAPERQTSIPLYERVPNLEIAIPWENNYFLLVVHEYKSYHASCDCYNVVSYFHFDRMTMINPEPGDWSSYFHRFMQGKMVFGSWYDRVNSWWKKKQTYSNLHYMFYEDLVEDTGLEIDKLCCFLGLSLSVKEKERITGKVHFDDMKRNNMVNSSTFPGMDFKMSSFKRKGKVGDWKNHFTVAQSEEFDEDYKWKLCSMSQGALHKERIF
uniref:Sulfotransferase n=1 Tax=Lates calcarifer TaxID=8187 RepID=A0A4W6EQ81_LATCA